MIYSQETPESFLRATSGAIHWCELLRNFTLAVTSDQWRPRHDGLVPDKFMADLQFHLTEAIEAASHLQHEMGRKMPHVYRAVFNIEPDPRTRAEIFEQDIKPAIEAASDKEREEDGEA